MVLDLAAGTVTGVGGTDAISRFNTTAEGSPHDDENYGTERGDFLIGDQGRDVVHGRRGDDLLWLYLGAAALHGDAGDDTLVALGHDRSGSGDLDAMAFDGGDGHDLFLLARGVGSESALRLDLASGEITGDGHASLLGIEDLYDNEGDHTLVGDDVANTLKGEQGDDTIVGGRGDDTGFGGDGTDSCDTEVRRGCES